MAQINAMTLQEMLRQQNTVSIGWLQKELALTYSEARQLVGYLQKRGWLGEEKAFGYKVVKTALFLRELERTEVGELVDAFTNDCQIVMNRLQEEPAEGADFGTLEKSVRGESDTREAVEILLRHKLIFFWDGFYFLRVNRKTVEAFKEMMLRKRLMERRETMDRKRLIACFDALFA
ncbi:MAG: hypothetical protein IKU07_01395 [Oscillospiraceae bacterium]|nr:hypothetical protein [Oscillospiraceae bacterium]